MVVSLQTRLEFRTLTLIRSDFVSIDNRLAVNSIEADGMYYEPKSERLFVASRGRDTISEVMVDKSGRCCTTRSILTTIGCKRESAGLRKAENTETCTILKQLTDGLFGQGYNYRTHLFSYDAVKKNLYHLQTHWNAGEGLNDNIKHQKIGVYSLENEEFEYWGEIRNDRLVQEASSTDKTVSAVLRETSSQSIAGISATQGEAWDLCLMYSNGFRLYIDLLVTSGNNKLATARLHSYLAARSINLAKRVSPSMQTGLYQEFNQMKKTTSFVGFDQIRAVVQKQTSSDGSLTLTVHNRTSCVPPAEQYDTTTKEIRPSERFLTHSVSSLFDVFCSL